MPDPFKHTVLDACELVPESWQARFGGGPVWAFNPGILRDGSGWIAAYRVVGPDAVRRIAACRLDAAFRVIAGSRVPVSDGIGFPDRPGYLDRVRSWFADPRLYRLAGRLFLYWNSGWHEPRNFQFLQELDAASLVPVGTPRELRAAGPKRALEKNWTFFGDGPFYALYSVRPHRVLEFSPDGTDDIVFSEVAAVDWDDGGYSRKYGELRGGAPPQRVGGDYFAIGHSVHGSPGNYRYEAAAHRFSAEPPFVPTGAPVAPIRLSKPFKDNRLYDKLNPAAGEVIYPCGAVFENGNWVVSYGINDERCAISVIPHAEILAALQPLRA